MGGGIRRETRGKRAQRGLGTRAGALFLHIEKCPKCLIASSHTVVSRPLALRRKSSGADQKLVQYVRQIGAFEASRPFFSKFRRGCVGHEYHFMLGPAGPRYAMTGSSLLWAKREHQCAFPGLFVFSTHFDSAVFRPTCPLPIPPPPLLFPKEKAPHHRVLSLK